MGNINYDKPSSEARVKDVRTKSAEGDIYLMLIGAGAVGLKRALHDTSTVIYDTLHIILYGVRQSVANKATCRQSACSVVFFPRVFPVTLLSVLIR